MKTIMKRLMMAAVLAIAMIGSMAACGITTKPSIPFVQKMRSEDYMYRILDGEWFRDDQCGKIVVDCSGDEKTVAMYEMTDNGNWVPVGKTVILKLEYPAGEDTVVKFHFVSADEKNETNEWILDHEFVLDTEKEILKFKVSDYNLQEYTKK